MQVFLGLSFTEEGNILLSPDESKHCIKVLRHKAGDVIYVIDGVGNFYEAEITAADPQACVASIRRKRRVSGEKPYLLHIAISPIKNVDRLEWLVEKGTELGVDEFSFVICKRTEKLGVRTDRFRKIAESAVKQSVQGIIPKVNEGIRFEDFIEKEKDSKDRKFLAHCAGGKKEHLKNILTERRVLVMIGPEGDFDEGEIALAGMNGFEALNLGESRLRTETAGLLIAAGFRAAH